MDLPTYTNVWRIEKRLYKLYDLRLPMPLPLVTIGVYAGAFLPWIVLLQFLGVPFATPWHVLYLVPPGPRLAGDPSCHRRQAAHRTPPIPRPLRHRAAHLVPPHPDP